MAKETLTFLKVGTEWIELEIISESDVTLTTFGYALFYGSRRLRLIVNMDSIFQQSH